MWIEHDIVEYYSRRADEDEAEAANGEGEPLAQAVAGHLAGRVLDVGCGYGRYLQRCGPGSVGLDPAAGMLRRAQREVSGARLVRGDAGSLPFRRDSFDLVLAAFTYGHLLSNAATRFVAEARRVAPRLLIIESAYTAGHRGEEWQDRRLSDGSQWLIYKRLFTADGLAAEIGGEPIFRGRVFVAVVA